MNVRLFILLLALMIPAIAYASPTAPQQVRQRLDDALRGQIKQLLTTSFSKGQSPSGGFTAEQLDQQVDALLQQALVRYGPTFTLPQQNAQRLLTKGLDDADNLATMKRNWESYKKTALPLPALMKYLHEQVEAGAVSGGWDLEMARRVSDAHLTEIADAQRRYEESQKKNP